MVNDSDPDGDALTVSLVSGPANGTVTVNANGSFVYTPSPGYFGSDSFTYQSTDPSGLSSTATVTIAVTAVVPVRSSSWQTWTLEPHIDTRRRAAHSATQP